jgi:hypothetical protein
MNSKEAYLVAEDPLPTNNGMQEETPLRQRFMVAPFFMTMDIPRVARTATTTRFPGENHAVSSGMLFATCPTPLDEVSRASSYEIEIYRRAVYGTFRFGCAIEVPTPEPV